MLEELREKGDEVELLNKSSTSELEKTGVELASLKRENRSMRMNGDQVLLDLKTDNTIMREKVAHFYEPLQRCCYMCTLCSFRN